MNDTDETNSVDLKFSRSRSQSPGLTDRLPPHSIEAEQGVLGCILLAQDDSMPVCIEKLGAEAFYDLRHQSTFQAMVEMYDGRQAIDVITLQQRLKDKQLLDQVGGLAYLSSLPDAVPSAANLAYYVDIVREKFLCRRMIQTCVDAVGKLYECEGDAEQILDDVEKDIMRVNELRTQRQMPSMRDLVNKAVCTIEEYHEKRGQTTGIATGFADLDALTHGLHAGEMVIIAARPSIGKTSLAMNIAENVAVDREIPVGVFSLEMTVDSLVMRMLCGRSRVNIRTVRDGFMAERDFPRLTGAATALANSQIWVDDTSGLSILQLRARARRMVQQHGVKLFVVDYLQLLKSTSKRATNREQEISDISSGIKGLAKELGVPIIVLSQLNRDLERGGGRRPRLSDLRESGSIEQDADVVGLLYRQDDEDSGGDPIQVNLLIAKQRNGPTGEIQLVFFKSHTRFESASVVTEVN